MSETDLQTAQAALQSEIQPEIDFLLARVSTYLDKLERREQSLIARCELQEGRLSHASAVKDDGAADASGRATAAASIEGLKAKQLRQKKDRLSYAVERLTLQAQQRERQLRKSMAGH